MSRNVKLGPVLTPEARYLSRFAAYFPEFDLAPRPLPAAELAALGGVVEVNQRLAALGQSPVEPGP